MMFWQKSKTMQYACANVHFTIQYAYLREGRECFFIFVSKPKIIPLNSHEHQIKDKQTLLQTKFFFSKENGKGENLFFLKEQHQAHLYANAL